MEIEEIEIVNEELQQWKGNLFLPLYVQIFMIINSKGKTIDQMKEISINSNESENIMYLLEEWKLQYEPTSSPL